MFLQLNQMQTVLITGLFKADGRLFTLLKVDIKVTHSNGHRFCKLSVVANNVCDTVNYKETVYISRMASKASMLVPRNLYRQFHLTFDNVSGNGLT